MISMRVKDVHGGLKEYSRQHIIRSCTRAGFDDNTAEEIESRVFERAWDEITTRKLHSIVYSEMKNRNEIFALRFRLREAIAELNPNYSEFEKYITKVLRIDGFDAEWSPRPKPRGECIEHEIDVVAEQHGTTYMIECKHHYHHHRFTGLDIPMRQWSRLEDLKRGYEHGINNAVKADEAWVIVNTKLSDHAKRYAECKNIRMTAWKYSNEDYSLDSLVERNKAYPVTILRPPQHVRTELSKKDILTVQDLIGLTDQQIEKIPVKNSVMRNIQRTAEEMVNK